MINHADMAPSDVQSRGTSTRGGRGAMRRGRGASRGGARGGRGGIRMRSLPEGAYTGKQDRIKKTLVESAKLRGQYRKLLQKEGLEHTSARRDYGDVEQDEEVDDDDDAKLAGKRPTRIPANVPAASTSDDDEIDLDADMDKDSDDEVLAMRRRRDAVEHSTALPEAPIARQHKQLRTTAIPKSERRARNLSNFNDRYAKQSDLRRQRAEAAEAERERRQHAIRQRELHSKRAKTYTKTGQPKMADRMANMLDQIRAMT